MRINMSCTSFLMISLLSDSKSISLDTPSEQNKIKTKFLSIEDLINNSEEKKHFKQVQTIYFRTSVFPWIEGGHLLKVLAKMRGTCCKEGDLIEGAFVKLVQK